MGVIGRLVGDAVNGPKYAAGMPGGDDQWYQPFNMINIQSRSGTLVSPESALTLAAVYACVRVLAETVSMLPLVTLRSTEEARDLGNGRTGLYDRKTIAKDLGLYDVLMHRPNEIQTAVEFKEMMMGHCALRGNFYAYILPGERGAVDQLIPLNPDRMRIWALPEGSSLLQTFGKDAFTSTQRENIGGWPRRLIYQYTWGLPTPLGANTVATINQGKVVYFSPDEVFHLRGLTFDGISGVSVVRFARDSIGLAQAADGFAQRMFNNNAVPGGALRHPMKLDDTTAKRIARSWEEAHAGWRNAGKVAVLEEGMEWQQIGMTTDDAQYLESRQFSIQEIARWFRMPPHLIQDLTRATYSNIEHQSLEFMMFTMMPWLRRIEASIKRDLVVQTREDVLKGIEIFARFKTDELLRGDKLSRYGAYRIAIAAGFMTRNEARIEEDMEPIEGLDEPLQQLNMATPDLAEEQQRQRDQKTDEKNDKDDKDARAQLIARNAAERVIRKEMSALEHQLKRLKAKSWDAGHMDDWTDLFYGEHLEFVMQALALSRERAATYCGFAADTVKRDHEIRDPQRHVNMMVLLAMDPLEKEVKALEAITATR